MEEVYTVQEVAQNLKVSERTVRNWIESGELPAFPIGKRGYRISKADLQVFIDERKKRNLDIKDDRGYPNYIYRALSFLFISFQFLSVYFHQINQAGSSPVGDVVFLCLGLGSRRQR